MSISKLYLTDFPFGNVFINVMEILQDKMNDKNSLEINDKIKLNYDAITDPLEGKLIHKFLTLEYKHSTLKTFYVSMRNEMLYEVTFEEKVPVGNHEYNILLFGAGVYKCNYFNYIKLTPEIYEVVYSLFNLISKSIYQ